MSVSATLGASGLQTVSTEYRPERVTTRRLSPGRAFGLPLLFTLLLAGFALLDPIRGNATLWWSFIGTATALLVWNAVLLQSAVRARRVLTLEIGLRKQHYLQACAQASVLLYWGWYWPEVYGSAYLIAAQLVFAYAFDMLLGWARRDTCTIGFAPFPVIFSINLFLWFKHDWFYLQFAMVALGFAAKELVRWNKDGRLTHIFNPSSFPLAAFSVALLLTGMSDATWGREIAITQFYPPQMFLMLFLIGLPGQYFFGVTSMTMSAVVTTYLCGLVYFAATGTYFFLDSYIPIAVFLGMHLLFTDPSTSPRTELGRIIFGVAYGLSTVVLYKLLTDAGLPAFYDKLLQVPLLNLSIKAIDRAARSGFLRRFDPAALGRSLAPRSRNLVAMSAWALVFGVMSAAEGVGDNHRGQWVPFWQQACSEGRSNACDHLARMQSKFCDAGSGWACSEYAVLQTGRAIEGPGPTAALQVGCEIGFGPACTNLERAARGDPLISATPTLDDYRVVLRGSKAPLAEHTSEHLYARACQQGWPDTCGRGRRTSSRQ
jgi:hypothetical protein